MPSETEKEHTRDLSEFTTLFILVGGPQSRVWGSQDMETLFVWSSQENAQKFIKMLKLQEARAIEEPVEQIRAKGRHLGFAEVLVDFMEEGNPSNNEGLRIAL